MHVESWSVSRAVGVVGVLDTAGDKTSEGSSLGTTKQRFIPSMQNNMRPPRKINAVFSGTFAVQGKPEKSIMYHHKHEEAV